MQHLPDSQCRRCGRTQEDVWQAVDHQGCWAMTATICDCGHHWTMLYTAPVNLAPLRTWIERGCQPAEGPVVTASSQLWRTYRLEGVSPALIAAAS